jgi:hypothetical protein
MKDTLQKVFKEFSIELPLYAVLMAAYIFLVLHFLGSSLAELFHDHRRIYAVLALALIIGQGFVLELIVRTLLGLVRGKKEE